MSLRLLLCCPAALMMLLLGLTGLLAPAAAGVALLSVLPPPAGLCRADARALLASLYEHFDHRLALN